jgi:hypothetical protein
MIILIKLLLLTYLIYQVNVLFIIGAACLANKELPFTYFQDVWACKNTFNNTGRVIEILGIPALIFMYFIYYLFQYIKDLFAFRSN